METWRLTSSVNSFQDETNPGFIRKRAEMKLLYLYYHDVYTKAVILTCFIRFSFNVCRNNITKYYVGNEIYSFIIKYNFVHSVFWNFYWLVKMLLHHLQYWDYYLANAKIQFKVVSFLHF